MHRILSIKSAYQFNMMHNTWSKLRPVSHSDWDYSRFWSWMTTSWGFQSWGGSYGSNMSQMDFGARPWNVQEGKMLQFVLLVTGGAYTEILEIGLGDWFRFLIRLKCHLLFKSRFLSKDWKWSTFENGIALYGKSLSKIQKYMMVYITYNWKLYTSEVARCVWFAFE